MIRRPPRSTLDRSSAASDVYKRQNLNREKLYNDTPEFINQPDELKKDFVVAVSYTHLRAHETVLDLVCRLLLEKKKNTKSRDYIRIHHYTEVISHTVNEDQVNNIEHNMP